MSEHTKEPWKYTPEHGIRHITSETGRMLATVHSLYDGIDNDARDREADDNARRIVACVNACAGVETDQLERIAGNPYLQSPVNLVRDLNISSAQRDEFRRQRDELLAALMQISDEAAESTQMSIQSLRGDLGRIKRIASAAIDKAEGRP